ncbi:hypothetical protein FJ420_31100 [Mesorhizobium sp. B3-1-3]|uniref:LodA/GoxA family CTQ-dependent oxidase n=1 Tax=unclassified Mesorhizobium TaxID=325217 RepID=UPI00112D1D25|nr:MULTISPECIES: LodA/GoxA family CTQ-dependent oxidase [unclassified Mesorhizobium]TPI60964.1 hypothetical protein FJ420_31100 [Mesorhizobium sp. B3-1-3]TPI67966.1 hypothetical protein FJ424_08345 [Mesorhizobium sp. B3-1-8]
MDTTLIEAIKVYPPLGIARVGNATGQDDFVAGPEVIGGPATMPDGTPARFLEHFRAADGSIKRQAARFRVYAHLKDGSVKEITADDAKIEWSVAVANIKAGWYEFNQAMDLPDDMSKPAMRRNRPDQISIPGGRRALDIVPTPLTIEGRNASAISFSDGQFWNRIVYLGELRTDALGRLLFLGGRGTSAAFKGSVTPLTFANNVGWHDDISDGPVRATVSFPGQEPIEAEAGYVVVTPPNFAPGTTGLVTMDDTVREVFQDQAWIAAPTTTRFTTDIWPIFDRLTGLQWVDHGLFVIHGEGSPLDARNQKVIDRLKDVSDANAAWRKGVFALFRRPRSDGPFIEAQIPQIYGDAVDTLFDLPNRPAPQALMSVTPTQYEHLRRWADGSFTDDWTGVPTPPAFDSLSAADQVEHLKRASLHDCLGGPFHPGIEITWIMRIPLLWKEAYRLKVLPGMKPARQDYGDILNPEVCTGSGGPFDGAAAGALTRFMGVPWQTDGVSCNSSADYFPSTFLSMPTFWGARVPDQVLAQASYERASALDPKTASLQIHKHFALRSDWLRDIRALDYYGRIALSIKKWAELGMVLPSRNPPKHLPADTRFEQGRSNEPAGSDLKYALVVAVESLDKQAVAAGAALVHETAVPKARVPGRPGFRQGEV